VNNNQSLSLGESVFNYLDLSGSNRAEARPFAETIKVTKLEPPVEELVISQPQSKNSPTAKQSPDDTPQNSKVKQISSEVANNSSQGIFFT